MTAGIMTAFRDLQPCLSFCLLHCLVRRPVEAVPFTTGVGWKDAIEMAEESLDPRDGMQQEFIGLIEKARKIYSRQRRKRISNAIKRAV